MVKDKKKTLTISSNLTKKIDTSNIQSSGKKSFSVEKKKPFMANFYKINRSKFNISILKQKGKILKENLLNKKQLKILLKKTTNQLVKPN